MLGRELAARPDREPPGAAAHAAFQEVRPRPQDDRGSVRGRFL